MKTSMQSVQLHLQKTVYFNSLWKDFLLKLAAICILVSIYHIYIQGTVWTTMTTFDALSIVCIGFSACFIARVKNSVSAFKSSFILSLLQCIWFCYFVHERMIKNWKRGDLHPSQLPLGAIYFFIAWGSDRYMATSLIIAEHSLRALQKYD